MSEDYPDPPRTEWGGIALLSEADENDDAVPDPEEYRDIHGRVIDEENWKTVQHKILEEGTYADRPETAPFDGAKYHATDINTVFVWDASSEEWGALNTGTEGQPIPGETNLEALRTVVSRSEREPVYDIKAWGAVGNGETENREVFQEVCDELETEGGGTLYVPDGDFVVTPDTDWEHNTGFRVPSNTTVKLDGNILAGAVTGVGENQEWSIFEPRGVTGDRAERVDIIGRGKVDGRQSEGIHDTTPGTVEGELVNWIYCNDYLIWGIEVTDAGSDGIRRTKGDGGKVIGVYSHDNAGMGIHTTTDSNNGMVAFNTVEQNGEEVTRPGIDQGVEASNNTYIGNISRNNYQNYRIRGENAQFDESNRSLGTTAEVDNFPGIKGSFAAFFQSSNQTVADGAKEKVEYDSVGPDGDPWGGFDGANYEYEIQEPGTYRVDATARLSGGGTGYAELLLERNGSVINRQYVSLDGERKTISTSKTRRMDNGDTLKVFFRPTTDATDELLAGSNIDSKLEIVKISNAGA